MPNITFRCRFITPAFLGGADPKGTPELRPPSIKGALRFWWRAQAGISDVQKLRERESEIFGGVEGDKAKKSSFSIRVANDDFELGEVLPESWIKVKTKGREVRVNIFEYLGYGTFDYVKGSGNVLNRSFIKPNQNFDVILIFNKPEFQEEVCRAFRLLSQFGGLGNRSRNGYGSFQIQRDSSPLGWLSALESLRAGSKKGFNSFSEEISCFQTESYDSVNDAWAALGKSYKNAREYVDRPHDFRYRAYLASPIIENKKQTTFLDRHSKPYFMSIVRDGEDFRGILLYLPYQFLDDSKDMMIDLLKSKKGGFNSMLSYYDLEYQLKNRPLKEHQTAFNEANGFFQDELCHEDNIEPLTQIL